MEFRNAFPIAVLLGGMCGASIAGAKAPERFGVSYFIEPTSAEARPATLAVPGLTPIVEFDIPVVRNEHVERFVTLFHERQPDRIALYLKRGGRYEGMIRQKLRERGMPEDLLYLAMIESGFNPNARSKAQAVGLWQFIAETGRRYGLRIDAYVDERRDPEKSTDAALRYLSDLHRRFGSWNLAAAAYNTGENRVARIMREETGSERGDETSFWVIRSRLPGETREYVPLIFAAAVVGKEPERFGITRVERWLPVETEEVEVPGGTPLVVVAEAAGHSEKQIRALNPQLVQGITPPREVYPVRVPVGRGADYAANFERVRTAHAAKRPVATPKLASASVAPAAQRARPAARAHTVRQGENLTVIAKRHGVSVGSLQRANGLSQRSVIRPGQRLRIPN
jgi:membrane-bound lytic murein transglycosylase D